MNKHTAATNDDASTPSACACCAPSTGRRNFMMSAGAVAAVAALPSLALAAAPGQRVIDVHHHFEYSGKNADGTAWTIEGAVQQLDMNGITTAIAYAGPVFDGGADGAKTARDRNEWSTQLCQRYPGRFGLFASLPMNNVEAALAEIAHALDVLKADGFGLATQYGDAWLGDPKFEPIFQELNRRKAVVYVHPAQAPCCTPETLSYEKEPVSAPWIEFTTNTARTILSLWAAGTTRRLPDIKFIFCHGGGVMPILLGRITGFKNWKPVGPDPLKKMFPEGVYVEFAKLYFDCAQAYAPETFDLLRKVIPSTHLLFGSDYSYFPISHAAGQLRDLKLPADLERKVKGANAAAILPRWSK
ncbi:MAG: amidohydrolase family protein [Pseudomonadota bacterium]